jgi:hypothetical protein
LVKGERVGYLLNWPHVRPLHFLQPQPTLRGIRNPEQVAAVLTRALTASGAASATPAANDASAPAADAPQSSALA